MSSSQKKHQAKEMLNAKILLSCNASMLVTTAELCLQICTIVTYQLKTVKIYK